ARNRMTRRSNGLWMLAPIALAASGCFSRDFLRSDAPLPHEDPHAWKQFWQTDKANSPPPYPELQTVGAVTPGPSSASGTNARVQVGKKYQAHRVPPPPAEPKPLPDVVQPMIVPPPAAVSMQPDRRDPLVRALECMLENRHQEALQQLQSYDPATRELLL